MVRVLPVVAVGVLAAGAAVVLGAWYPSAPQRGAAVRQAPPPDTTGAALWAHLKAAEYQKTWQTWPGRGWS